MAVRVNEGDFDPQQFLSSVASGNPSDLVYMDRGLIGTYAAKGALQPLDDLISELDIDTDQYRKPAMTQVTVDDKVYGIPEFYNTRNILINGKAMREAGLSPQDLSTTDWNKLHANAAKLYQAKGSGISRIGFDPKLPEFLPLWAKANGADLVNSDGSPNLDDPKIAEALAYAYSLIAEQGGWSKFKAFRDTWDIFGAGNAFVKNQAVAFPWEGWYVNVLVQSSPNLELQSVPFTDRQGKPISFCDGSAWALPKGAKNSKAAAQWMKTMTATDT
ncbi:MAG: extracellular solute-binding protein [Jatrophihabitantaceae bacterium]